MSCPAVAQMLAITLYQKRFFPYYVFSILGGLDTEGLFAVHLSHHLYWIYCFTGKGIVYSFDPVGSYERQTCRAGGSAASLLQPFLDNQIDKKNMKNTPFVLPTKEEAIKIAKDAFSSATERDIHTGDYLQIFVVTKDGVKVDRYDLKKD
jgi:20S proteasome subunit beta 6